MDMNLLRCKIKKQNVQLIDLAKSLSIDYATLYRKMNGISEFSCSEIGKIKNVLNLTNNEMNKIFFE